MTVDISALANMIRRLDLSATIKSFLVVAAFLSVALNIISVKEYVGDLLLYNFFDDEGLGFVIAQAALLSIVALSPLLFIVWDWMLRKPWQHLAAIAGALTGGVGFAIIGGALGSLGMMVLSELEAGETKPHLLAATPLAAALFLLSAWLIARSVRARRVLRWLLLIVVVLFVAALLYPTFAGIVEAEEQDHAELLFGFAGMIITVVALLWFFIRIVRHQIAFSSDRPRELMLGALHKKSFWARLAFLAGLPSSLWHARAIATPEFWTFLLARPVTYVGFAVTAASLGEDLINYRVFAPGVGLVVGGHLLFALGKRLAARHIWNPDNPADDRSPVLFLRSFEDDQLRFRRPWWNIFGHLVGLWSFRRNADEVLIDEIAQYGPVVALGMPGEKDVPFGASRYYASHDDWQEIVTKTAKLARAIVIAAGNTPGVLWEYELIARENLLDRTLLLFAPEPNDPTVDADAIAEFSAAVGGHERIELPPEGKPIALFPVGKSHVLLTADKRSDSAYLAALRAHFQGCRPVHLAGELL